MTTVEISLPNPENLSELPQYKDIKRQPMVWRSDPKYHTYEAEVDFDEQLLSILAGGGFSEKSCPKEGEWLAVSMVGAICIVTTEETLDPLSCHLITTSGDLYWRLWQLAWPRLKKLKETKRISKRLFESLCRLLVPENHLGDSLDRGYTDCQAASLWKEYEYCPGQSSFGSLSLSVYKRGQNLEGLSVNEMIILKEFFLALASMREQVYEKIRPLYHW